MIVRIKPCRDSANSYAPQIEVTANKYVVTLSLDNPEREIQISQEDWRKLNKIVKGERNAEE